MGRSRLIDGMGGVGLRLDFALAAVGSCFCMGALAGVRVLINGSEPLPKTQNGNTTRHAQ